MFPAFAIQEMLAFVSSPRFVEHRVPDALADRAGGHPERAQRIAAMNAAVRQAGLIRSPNPFADFELDFGISADGPELLELAPEAPADDATLALVHPPDYIRFIGEIAQRGGGFADHGETYVGPKSDEVARLALASAIRAADAVISGQAKRAFAAVRPPGHHAEPARAMGFCLYATAAITVRHLQRTHGLSRVAVVDFDVHHGNGTQAVFWRDPGVLNISLHQDPRTLWPGTGFAHEIGEGAGRGFTMNLPLAPGTEDNAYLAALRDQALPRVRDFAPEALVVCAGFDAHSADPLAQLALSSEGFGRIGTELARLADETCAGRLIATLEGGYNLRALGQSAVAFLRAIS